MITNNKEKTKMKRNNLKWALPMAALCLLATACSKENSNEPTAPKTRELTINCGIGATAATPGTRAGVKPGNTDKTKEYFIWHEKDAFNAYLIPGGSSSYDATPQSFVIQNYSNGAPSKSASFKCDYFPNNDNSYKMLAVYPKARFTRADDVFTVTVPYTQTQIGKDNTNHLSKSMNMYAITEVPAGSQDPNLTFRHLTSLLRFTVTNKNAESCRISQITIAGVNTTEPIFGTKSSLEVLNWEDGTIKTTSIEATNVVDFNLKTSSSDIKGILLSGTNAPDGSVVDVYATVGQGKTALTGLSIDFRIIVGDADDNGQEYYYSMKLAGDDIIAANDGATTWEPGKRYWFDLVVDNMLTVTLKKVTPITGWGDEDNL